MTQLEHILDFQTMVNIHSVIFDKCGNRSDEWVAGQIIDILSGWPGKWIHNCNSLDAWLDHDKKTVRCGMYAVWDVAVWKIGEGWL